MKYRGKYTQTLRAVVCKVLYSAGGYIGINVANSDNSIGSSSQRRLCRTISREQVRSWYARVFSLVAFSIWPESVCLFAIANVLVAVANGAVEVRVRCGHVGSSLACVCEWASASNLQLFRFCVVRCANAEFAARAAFVAAKMYCSPTGNCAPVRLELAFFTAISHRTCRRPMQSHCTDTDVRCQRNKPAMSMQKRRREQFHLSCKSVITFFLAANSFFPFLTKRTREAHAMFQNRISIPPLMQYSCGLCYVRDFHWVASECGLHLFGTENGWGNHLHFACGGIEYAISSESNDFSFENFKCSALRTHSRTAKKQDRKRFFRLLNWFQSSLLALNWKINEWNPAFSEISWTTFLEYWSQVDNKITPFNVKEIRNIIITIGSNEPRRE